LVPESLPSAKVALMESSVRVPAASVVARVPIRSPAAIPVRYSDQIPCSDPGEILLLLVVTPHPGDCLGGEIDRRAERDRCKRPPDLTRDHGEFEVAVTRTTVLFWNRDTQPAEFRNALPELLAVAGIRFENLSNVDQR